MQNTRRVSPYSSFGSSLDGSSDWSNNHAMNTTSKNMWTIVQIDFGLLSFAAPSNQPILCLPSFFKTTKSFDINDVDIGDGLP